MKWQSALFIFWIPIVFSCRKEVPQGNVAPKITNPTDYLLESITWSGPTTNGQSQLFFYNSDNLVSSLETIQWCCGTTTMADTTYEYFQYSNGLCKKVTVSGTFSGNGSIIYEYNDRGLPEKATTYARDRFQSIDLYEYDLADHLIRVTDSSWEINFTYSYSYDNQGNPTTLSILDVPGQKINRYQWTSFDDKVNFAKAINGLPPGCANLDRYNFYSTSSPHNYLSYNYYYHVDISQPSGSPWTVENKFQYNEEGLPTQMLSGSWIVTFKYRKYK